MLVHGLPIYHFPLALNDLTASAPSPASIRTVLSPSTRTSALFSFLKRWQDTWQTVAHGRGMHGTHRWLLNHLPTHPLAHMPACSRRLSVKLCVCPSSSISSFPSVLLNLSLSLLLPSTSSPRWLVWLYVYSCLSAWRIQDLGKERCAKEVTSSILWSHKSWIMRHKYYTGKEFNMSHELFLGWVSVWNKESGC